VRLATPLGEHSAACLVHTYDDILKAARELAPGLDFVLVLVVGDGLLRLPSASMLPLLRLGIHDRSLILLHSEKTVKELGDAVQPFNMETVLFQRRATQPRRGNNGNDNNNNIGNRIVDVEAPLRGPQFFGIPPYVRVADDQPYAYLLVFTVEFLMDEVIDDAVEGYGEEWFNAQLAHITRPFRWFKVPRAALNHLTIEQLFRQQADVPEEAEFRLFRSQARDDNITLAESFLPDFPNGVGEEYLASPARNLLDVSVWCLVLFGPIDDVIRQQLQDPPLDKANALAILCEELLNPHRRGFHDLIQRCFITFQNVQDIGAAEHNHWIWCAMVLCDMLPLAVQHRDDELVQIILACLGHDHVAKWISNSNLVTSIAGGHYPTFIALLRGAWNPDVQASANVVLNRLNAPAVVADIRSSRIVELGAGYRRLDERVGYVLCFNRAGAAPIPSLVVSGKCANLTLKFLGCKEVTMESDFDALQVDWVPDHENLLRQQPDDVEEFFEHRPRGVNKTVIVSIHAHGCLTALHGVQLIGIHGNRIVSVQYILNRIALITGARSVVCLAETCSMLPPNPAELAEDFFHEPPLPGHQFGIIYAVQRLEPARAGFLGGHFTSAWVSAVKRGMTLRQLAEAVNATPLQVTGNFDQITRIETRGGFDPDSFYF
jgi:hypothetical protein